jgi:hypothetical protein
MRTKAKDISHGERIQLYLARAAEAEEMANSATDPGVRESFSRVARSWRKLVLQHPLPNRLAEASRQEQ